MAYDMVVMRTNPHLSNSMRRLEDAFLSCKEEMEKKWQEVLSEYKGEKQTKWINLVQWCWQNYIPWKITPVFLFSSHRSFTDTVEDGFAFIILRITYLYICGSILVRLHITYIFMLKVKGHNVSIFIMLMSNLYSVHTQITCFLCLSSWKIILTSSPIYVQFFNTWTNWGQRSGWGYSGPSQWYCTSTCLSRKTKKIFFFQNEKQVKF